MAAAQQPTQFASIWIDSSGLHVAEQNGTENEPEGIPIGFDSLTDAYTALGLFCASKEQSAENCEPCSVSNREDM
jgi:hypothetical protein